MGWFSRNKPKEPVYIFDPLPDITAYELAKILPMTIPEPYRSIETLTAMFQALPSECRRHIKVKESS